MNILFSVVAVSSIAILLCFLAALVRESRTAPRRLRGHFLRAHLYPQKNKERLLQRAKLRRIAPEHLPVNLTVDNDRPHSSAETYTRKRA